MAHHRSQFVFGSAFAAAAMLLSAAGPVAAQGLTPPGALRADSPEHWRVPSQRGLAPHATSSLEATDPPPASAHDTRALASAVFSEPGAAARAADKAADAIAPPIKPADPKPEWVDKPGVRVGGEGLLLSKPF